MNNGLAGLLQLDQVGKCYRRYRHPHDWLREKLGGKPTVDESWVLRDISFELHPGEALGIVGHNGAGKSTLLQIIAGTLTPTQGTVQRQGRIAALLELGAGFNPEFTGFENARLNAMLMGLSPTEVENRLPEIIEFSGIGEAIQRPVKTYSSGMFVRLAFAVATAVEPDILIIDEALSVGDGRFARKSFDRIMEIRDRGATLLFCSHALYQIEKLCERAIWIEQGRLIMDGPSKSVVTAYQTKIDQDALGITTNQPLETDIGCVEVPRLRRVRAYLNGELIETLRVTCISGYSELVLEVMVGVPHAWPVPQVAVSITHASGVMVFGTGNWLGPSAQPLIALGEDMHAIRLQFPQLALLAGTYRIDVAVTCENGIYFYDGVSGALMLEVVREDETQGLVALEHTWMVPQHG